MFDIQATRPDELPTLLFDLRVPAELQLPALETFLLAAAALAVGVGMLGWGRKLHRVAAVAVGAGAGLLGAGPLALALGVELLFARLALCIAGGLVALVLARVLWAALIAGLAGAVALLLAGRHFHKQVPSGQRPVFDSSAAGDLGSWAAEAGRYLQQLGDVLYNEYGGALLLAGGLAAGAVLVIMMLRLRLATYLAVSLLGAACIVAGAMGLAIGGRAELWPALVGNLLIPAVAAGALVVIGLAFQYYKDWASRSRREKGEGRDEDDKPPEKMTRAEIAAFSHEKE